MSVRTIAEKAVEKGKGIVRLVPTWVPRSFCVPGRRIKLHPDDYYALGGARGGIDERWFSSTTPADNGPETAPGEGLSYIIAGADDNAERVLLRDAIDELKSEIIGERIWKAHGRWPMYSKFFDNMGPLPHHIHQSDEAVAPLGLLGKPEAYFFPPQVNNHGGDFPFTFFGFNPGVTKDEVKTALMNFTKGDNRILELSRSYKLTPGTGWDVPPGLLHAPGSFCTYEPQKASDVYAMYQSLVNDQILEESALWKDSPPAKKGSFDYLVDVIDWDLNIDPDLYRNRFMKPKPARAEVEMKAEGYRDLWIVYKSKDFSAKELTILPGRSVTIRDAAAYGLIVLQGHGTMGVWDIESPSLIRYGQLTGDEFFVTEKAAKAGVLITNPSKTDPIVMLKHFGPENPDLIV
ncbi:MAG: hypothetical protein E4H36_03025 [Spirochaetales bacterium]|nr:MAG: hypothetical protein E4H36_03025 [Spirochaetales bacterium]